MVVNTAGFAQSVQFKKYDIKKQRLLIKMTGVYIYSISQGNIDIDSAMVLACSTNKVPLALSYDEDFNYGPSFPGSEMIDNHKIAEAKGIIKKSSGIDQIRLLLKLGSYYIFKPGNNQKDLQQALPFIKQAIKISKTEGKLKWQQQSTILLAIYYFQSGNVLQCQKLLAQNVQIARRQSDKNILAFALENQATYLLDTDPEKEKILQEAQSLYKILGEKTKEIEMLTKLVSLHFWSGNLQLAKEGSIDAYSFLKKINFKHTHYIASTIAFIDIYEKNQKEALQYALDGVKTMEETEDFGMADNFYLRLAAIYNQLGYVKESLVLYKKSIDIGQKFSIGKSWYKSFLSYCSGLTQLGRYKEALDYLEKTTKQYPPDNLFDKILIANTAAACYQNLNDVKNVERNYKIIDQYSSQITSPQTALDISKIYAEMALFYASIGQKVKAEQYQQKVLQTTSKYKISFNYPIFQLAEFKIDSLSGDYVSAIKKYQKFKFSNDSITNNSKRKEIEELRFKFETTQKEQNIKTLQVQTSLQKSRLEKSELKNKLSIGLLLLSLIILGLLYKFYKVKLKSHTKLQIKEREINLKNQNLQHLLNEKEWLMKEIHHRVKNNLQTVISLLNSQSEYVNDDLALSTIKSSQHRIHAMSLIHQKLYMHENISTINISQYINELIDYLKDAFHLKQQINFKIAIESLDLDVAQAIPLGLIINEAVTNSIKYAFPDQQHGNISISLSSCNDRQYLLTIQDNGIGISAENQKKNNSFGMTLMQGLSQDLEGVFSIRNSNGTLLQLYVDKTILDKEKLSDVPF